MALIQRGQVVGCLLDSGETVTQLVQVAIRIVAFIGVDQLVAIDEGVTRQQQRANLKQRERNHSRLVECGGNAVSVGPAKIHGDWLIQAVALIAMIVCVAIAQELAARR